MNHRRIGLELFGTQTASRDRGIGRYVRNLTAALLNQGPSEGYEFLLYAEDGPPTNLPASFPLTLLRPEPTVRDTVNRLTLTNPDQLDVLLFLNPLELTPGFDIPTRSPRGPKLAAIIYDLIPLIFQDDYLRKWPGSQYARRYLWALERLRTYDILLAISEATRLDTIRLLNVAPEKVVTIGTGGSDSTCSLTPANDPTDLACIEALGITRPFVFGVSATDPRKNLVGLIEAFATLPDSLQPNYQLVVTVKLNAFERDCLRAHAGQLGIGDQSLVLTGQVDDITLRALYRRAEVFIFPSYYEGFGLPIVEAMACGAAVVAGHNSSQPEAAGDAALLVDVRDPEAIAGAMARILTDRELARSMREQASAQASRFSWEAVAKRTLEAFRFCSPPPPPCPTRWEGWGGGLETPLFPSRAFPPLSLLKLSHPLQGGDNFRPLHLRVAYFLGPHDEHVPELALNLTVDLFHEPGNVPSSRFLSRKRSCFDARLFRRIDRLRRYEALVVRTAVEAERLDLMHDERLVIASENLGKLSDIINRGMR